MSVFLFCALLLIFEASCAPVEGGHETIEIKKNPEAEVEKMEDTPQAQSNKNPVQEWFENLSKNVTSNGQNAFNSLKEWFSQFSTNNNPASAASNLPVMYMGSFQLLKMPMPQIGDVIKGMGDLATAAQTVNKLTSGGLPLPLPGLQG